MKLSNSSLYLGLMQDVLRDVLIPELSSESAQTAAVILQHTVAELERRETTSPAILVKANRDGVALLSVMAEAISASGLEAPSLPNLPCDTNEDQAFSYLSKLNGEITSQLNRAAQLLSAIPDSARAPNANLLLQQAANWEYQLHIDLLRASAVDEKPAEHADPLPFSILEAFIQSVHPDGTQASLLSMERAEGGSGKQTFFITVAGADKQKTDLVVRKADKILMMTTGAYLIEREFHILKIVSEQGCLVPRPLWLGLNVPGTDGDFYIMERTPGRIPGTFLGGAESIPETFVRQLPVLLAELHNIPLEAFRGYIEEYDRPAILEETIEECTRQTINGWKEYAKSANQLPSPALTYMMDWLGRNVPENKGKPVMVHGDYNAHNILMHEGRVSAILDWEGAMFGAPELDLAYIRPHISKHIEWPEFLDIYRKSGGQPVDDSALDYYQAVLGMRVVHGLCAATKNLQDRTTDDYRIIMVQLGYVLDFMQRGLGACRES